MARGKISLILGALAGATLGLLFAPTRGKEFRELIKKERKKGGSGFDSVKKHAQKIQEDMLGSIDELKKNKTYAQIKEKTQSTIEDVTGLAAKDVKAFKNRASGNLKKAKKKLNDAVSKVKKKLK